MLLYRQEYEKVIYYEENIMNHNTIKLAAKLHSLNIDTWDNIKRVFLIKCLECVKDNFLISISDYAFVSQEALHILSWNYQDKKVYQEFIKELQIKLYEEKNRDAICEGVKAIINILIFWVNNVDNNQICYKGDVANIIEIIELISNLHISEGLDETIVINISEYLDKLIEVCYYAVPDEMSIIL